MHFVRAHKWLSTVENNTSHHRFEMDISYWGRVIFFGNWNILYIEMPALVSILNQNGWCWLKKPVHHFWSHQLLSLELWKGVAKGLLYPLPLLSLVNGWDGTKISDQLWDRYHSLSSESCIYYGLVESMNVVFPRYHFMKLECLCSIESWIKILNLRSIVGPILLNFGCHIQRLGAIGLPIYHFEVYLSNIPFKDYSCKKSD